MRIEKIVTAAETKQSCPFPMGLPRTFQVLAMTFEGTHSSF
jgi:hypothetical protein